MTWHRASFESLRLLSANFETYNNQTRYVLQRTTARHLRKPGSSPRLWRNGWYWIVFVFFSFPPHSSFHPADLAFFKQMNAAVAPATPFFLLCPWTRSTSSHPRTDVVIVPKNKGAIPARVRATTTTRRITGFSRAFGEKVR